MQLLDIGPRGYSTSVAVTNKAFTPLFDRAAKVTDIRITSPSADDQWTFSVGGRELFRGLVKTTGNQNPFGNSVVLGVDNRSWLPYVSDLLQAEVTIPVPNGQTLTIASVGGATANIEIEFKEVSVADIQPSMINHYQGSHFVAPIVQEMTAAVTGVGPTPLDTQIASAWVPPLLSGKPIPPDWKIQLIAAYLEPVSVNTFSGAANHVSNTVALQFKKNGQTCWTRDNTGLSLVPQAAAAGSANNVRLPSLCRLNPFQLMPIENNQWFDPAIVLQDGDNFEIDVLYAGDFVGNPSYLFPMVQFLADIVQVNP